jgi:hypothetical protein
VWINPAAARPRGDPACANTPGAELVKAVKTVAEGGSYLDLAVTHRVLTAFRSHASPALRPLHPSLTPASSRYSGSWAGAWPMVRSPASFTSAR